jgi:hypothetical protein
MPGMDTDRAKDRAHPDALPNELEADEAFAAKTIRSFIRDGRLASIPAREKRRLVVYRYLRDQVFTEDREYEEREVNQRLALFHPDVATIRRGMVDAGLVTRLGGIYRRR